MRVEEVEVGGRVEAPEERLQPGGVGGAVAGAAHPEAVGSSSAQIRYAECDYSVSDCTDVINDWTFSTVVDGLTGSNKDAMFPEIITDANRQFVVYQYLHSTLPPLQAFRIAVASRCAGGAWIIERVRDSGDAADHQTLAYGRPSVTLNRQENTIHVAFVELAGEGSTAYTPPWTISGDNSNLHWYSNEYTDCPPQ